MGDLGKLIGGKGFKTCPKCKKSPNLVTATLSSTDLSHSGSLEELVENLVKTWEMEASHKPDMTQWRTIDLSNYCVQGSIL